MKCGGFVYYNSKYKITVCIYLPPIETPIPFPPIAHSHPSHPLPQFPSQSQCPIPYPSQCPLSCWGKWLVHTHYVTKILWHVDENNYIIQIIQSVTTVT